MRMLDPIGAESASGRLIAVVDRVGHLPRSLAAPQDDDVFARVAGGGSLTRWIHALLVGSDVVPGVADGTGFEMGDCELAHFRVAGKQLHVVLLNCRASFDTG